MKFLTISTVKDVYYTLPQAEKAKLDAASTEFLFNFKKKMGDKLHFYSSPKGLISIGEYGSLEEYYQSLQQSPRAAAGYMNYDCIPLIEIDEKAIQAYLANAKAGK